MVTKKKLIEFLKVRGDWQEPYIYWVNLLYSNLNKLKEIEKELKDNLSVPGNAEGSFIVRNQHIKSFNEIISNIKLCSQQLLLSPKDYIDSKGTTDQNVTIRDTFNEED